LAPRHAFMALINVSLHDMTEHVWAHETEYRADEAYFCFKTWWIEQFLSSCRNTKQFVSFCRMLQRSKASPAASIRAVDHVESQDDSAVVPITNEMVEAFDIVFSRGTLSAARNELLTCNDSSSVWLQKHLPAFVSSDILLELILSHGGNAYARDVRRGVSLLHWAAGAGNLSCVQLLLSKFFNSGDPYMEASADRGGVWLRTDRDGATPLHWAAAGANAKEFGTGGHFDVCEYLISQVHPHERKEYVNVGTAGDGNTPLMWAAWSGTLATVQLLMRYRADPTRINKNGCSVSHWAASGGNLQVCKYLHDVVNVDFSAPNHGGNTPLTHAVAFGRADVVRWLRTDVVQDISEDEIAYQLAHDFVQWNSGNDIVQRQHVLSLFEAFSDE
jgi:Ankyrin repeats (3 copies)/Ankyrin repeats (many copies)